MEQNTYDWDRADAEHRKNIARMKEIAMRWGWRPSDGADRSRTPEERIAHLRVLADRLRAHAS